MTTQVTPTTENRTIKVLDCWSHAYNGITYANTVTSNINNVTDWNSEEEKYAMLSAGYPGAGGNINPLGYEEIKELRDPNRPF